MPYFNEALMIFTIFTNHYPLPVVLATSHPPANTSNFGNMLATSSSFRLENFPVASLNKRSAASFKPGSSFLMDKLSRRFCPLQANCSCASWWQYLAGEQSTDFFLGGGHFSRGKGCFVVRRYLQLRHLHSGNFLQFLPLLQGLAKAKDDQTIEKSLHSKTSVSPTCNYVHVDHHHNCVVHHHCFVHLRNCFFVHHNWFVRCQSGNLVESL